jgi:hypothetical protein
MYNMCTFMHMHEKRGTYSHSTLAKVLQLAGREPVRRLKSRYLHIMASNPETTRGGVGVRQRHLINEW